MFIRLNFRLVLLLCTIGVSSHAQNDQAPTLNIGDPAPQLQVRRWIKGTPVQKFQKGKIYVLEFWATWCKPCIAAMPHLSALAKKYTGQVKFLGIDIYEKKTTSIEKVKAFVDSMGYLMDYRVAADGNNFMVESWLGATGEKREGIPRTFVVNAEGKLAWIGHPKDLDKVLSKIVNNTWDIKETLAKRDFNKRLAEMDDSIRFELDRFTENRIKPGSSFGHVDDSVRLELIRFTNERFKSDDFGKPDSALLMINEIVRKEPKLKYAPFVAIHTFSSLLKTDLHEAYKYGKVAITTTTYDEPPYGFIIGEIEWYSDKLSLSSEIYQLCAEAYQAKIDQISYPEIVNMPKLYTKMAEWYWRANDKAKAIGALQKAIEALKKIKNFSVTEMDALESRLLEFKKI